MALRATAASVEVGTLWAGAQGASIDFAQLGEDRR
jgi:hypothetical protein